MNQTTGGQSMSDSSGAQSLAGSGAVRSNLVTGVLNWFEKYLLILVIEGLIAGIGAAGVSQTLVDQVNAVINTFMDLYGLIAPIAIFLILTPSLARLLANRKTGKFGLLVINWFALRKILASLWAIVFVLIVFRIPILPQGSLSLTDGISETVESLGRMMLTSSYFWAMYAAIAVSVLSTRAKAVTNVLERVMDFVETAGSYLLPLMPVFMFAIGAYIYGLPDNDYPRRHPKSCTSCLRRYFSTRCRRCPRSS